MTAALPGTGCPLGAARWEPRSPRQSPARPEARARGAAGGIPAISSAPSGMRPARCPTAARPGGGGRLRGPVTSRVWQLPGPRSPAPDSQRASSSPGDQTVPRAAPDLCGSPGPGSSPRGRRRLTRPRRRPPSRLPRQLAAEPGPPSPGSRPSSPRARPAARPLPICREAQGESAGSRARGHRQPGSREKKVSAPSSCTGLPRSGLGCGGPRHFAIPLRSHRLSLTRGWGIFWGPQGRGARRVPSRLERPELRAQSG